MEKLFGLFTDNRTMQIDFLSSGFWNPNKYGIQIDWPGTFYDLPKIKIDPKYKFVFTGDCFGISAQNTLEYLRKHNFKIFMVPKEPVIHKISKSYMFTHSVHTTKNGKSYFCPDLVFAPSEEYSNLWKDKTRCEIVGHPRYEQYLEKQKFSAIDIKKKFNLSLDKKIIFFPCFQSTFYKTVGKSEFCYDINHVREEIMIGLEELSKDSDKQIVIKIHPQSQQIYDKTKRKKLYYYDCGKQKELTDVIGLLKKYYENKSDKIVVIGDDRFVGKSFKELMWISDIVIGFKTSALLDAMYLQKKVIYFKPEKFSGENGFFEYETETTTVNNKNDLVNLIRDGAIKQTQNSKLVKQYLGPIDGKFCERVCSIIRSVFGA